MAWFEYKLKKGVFYYKAMAYQQSCFPCSLHVILRNLFPKDKGVPADDSIEHLWNKLQKDTQKKPELSKQAPDEADVHANLQKTDAVTDRMKKMKFISPTSLKAPITEKDLQKSIDAFQSDDFRAMVIGEAHATVIFKVPEGFVHFNPSPEVTPERVQVASTLTLSVMSEKGKLIGAVAEGGGKGGFGYGGSFILLMG